VITLQKLKVGTKRIDLLEFHVTARFNPVEKNPTWYSPRLATSSTKIFEQKRFQLVTFAAAAHTHDARPYKGAQSFEKLVEGVVCVADDQQRRRVPGRVPDVRVFQQHLRTQKKVQHLQSTAYCSRNVAVRTA